MPRALWLLSWLRFVGWVRRLGRMLRTVKGALLTLFVAILFALWVFSVVVAAFVRPATERVGTPELARMYGPMALLAYCLLLLALPSSERMIAFTPAEINFLFPAPFRRRQLIGYKMTVIALKTASGTLLLSILFLQYAHSFIAAYIGLLLMAMFIQFLMMALALVAATVGALAYGRGRRWLLALLGAAVVAGALLLRRHQWDRAGLILLIPELSRAPVISVILAPFRWFIEAFTAESLWPDLVLWSGLCLAVNAVVVLVIMTLDAQYLETAAAASERVYVRLQRLRRGGLASAWASASKARFSLPTFPWCGGVGPIAWRQMLAAVRGLRGLLVFLIIVGCMAGWPLLLSQSDDRADSARTIGAASAILTMSVFMLPLLLTFDFRGDVDRIDVLKSLPIAPSRLVIGQLMTPVLFASAVQFILLAILQVALGGLGKILPVLAAFLLPFNFLLFALENLLFLLFPTRMTPATPGDLQAMGRTMFSVFVKFTCLGLVAGVIALGATLVYFLLGERLAPALACAWLLSAGADAALVPALVLAFRKFDVAVDTPP
jgi:ABC-2 type transport system permease protein